MFSVTSIWRIFPFVSIPPTPRYSLWWRRITRRPVTIVFAVTWTEIYVRTLRRMFGLKKNDVTKTYWWLLHIKFKHYTYSCYDRHEVTNSLHILSCRPKGRYYLHVLDADSKLVMKEIIIMYGAKVVERHSAKFLWISSFSGKPSATGAEIGLHYCLNDCEYNSFFLLQCNKLSRHCCHFACWIPYRKCHLLL